MTAGPYEDAGDLISPAGLTGFWSDGQFGEVFGRSASMQAAFGAVLRPIVVVVDEQLSADYGNGLNGADGRAAPNLEDVRIPGQNL